MFRFGCRPPDPHISRRHRRLNCHFPHHLWSHHHLANNVRLEQRRYSCLASQERQAFETMWICKSNNRLTADIRQNALYVKGWPVPQP